MKIKTIRTLAIALVVSALGLTTAKADVLDTIKETIALPIEKSERIEKVTGKKKK